MTPAPQAPWRARSVRPGIALLTSLMVVLLLTWFLSETFFATGLELRSLQAFQDSTRARTLARATLKTVLVGLMQKESDFFSVIPPGGSGLAGIPIERGKLLQLDIRPTDGLYNLNDLAERQQGSAFMAARHRVFVNILSRIEVPGPDARSPKAPYPAAQASNLFAALVDWTDKDLNVTQSPDNGVGSEVAEVSPSEPEVVIKNALLDRLEELRMVRGVVESRLPWAEIEKEFTVSRPRSGGTELLPEKLNVNLAKPDDIIAYLEAHRVDDDAVVGSTDFGAEQRTVNECARNAAAIAEALVPEGATRPLHDNASVRNALTRAGIANVNAASKIFALHSQYYRVRITTEINDIQARLDAQVYVRRGGDGKGTAAEVLDEVLE